MRQLSCAHVAFPQTSCKLSNLFRYYRDAKQPAPAPEQAAKEAVPEKAPRVRLDPEALLREAEEGVENLDEVGCGSRFCGRADSLISCGTADGHAMADAAAAGVQWC